MKKYLLCLVFCLLGGIYLSQAQQQPCGDILPQLNLPYQLLACEEDDAVPIVDSVDLGEFYIVSGNLFLDDDYVYKFDATQYPLHSEQYVVFAGYGDDCPNGFYDTLSVVIDTCGSHCDPIDFGVEIPVEPCRDGGLVYIIDSARLDENDWMISGTSLLMNDGAYYFDPSSLLTVVHFVELTGYNDCQELSTKRFDITIKDCDSTYCDSIDFGVSLPTEVCNTDGLVYIIDSASLDANGWMINGSALVLSDDVYFFDPGSEITMPHYVELSAYNNCQELIAERFDITIKDCDSTDCDSIDFGVYLPTEVCNTDSLIYIIDSASLGANDWMINGTALVMQDEAYYFDPSSLLTVVHYVELSGYNNCQELISERFNITIKDCDSTDCDSIDFGLHLPEKICDTDSLVYVIETSTLEANGWTIEASKLILEIIDEVYFIDVQKTLSSPFPLDLSPSGIILSGYNDCGEFNQQQFNVYIEDCDSMGCDSIDFGIHLPYEICDDDSLYYLIEAAEVEMNGWSIQGTGVVLLDGIYFIDIDLLSALMIPSHYIEVSGYDNCGNHQSQTYNFTIIACNGCDSLDFGIQFPNFVCAEYGPVFIADSIYIDEQGWFLSGDGIILTDTGDYAFDPSRVTPEQYHSFEISGYNECDSLVSKVYTFYVATCDSCAGMEFPTNLPDLITNATHNYYLNTPEGGSYSGDGILVDDQGQYIFVPSLITSSVACITYNGALGCSIDKCVSIQQCYDSTFYIPDNFPYVACLTDDATFLNLEDFNGRFYIHGQGIVHESGEYYFSPGMFNEAQEIPVYIGQQLCSGGYYSAELKITLQDCSSDCHDVEFPLEIPDEICLDDSIHIILGSGDEINTYFTGEYVQYADAEGVYFLDLSNATTGYTTISYTSTNDCCKSQTVTVEVLIKSCLCGVYNFPEIPNSFCVEQGPYKIADFSHDLNIYGPVDLIEGAYYFAPDSIGLGEHTIHMYAADPCGDTLYKKVVVNVHDECVTGIKKDDLKILDVVPNPGIDLIAVKNVDDLVSYVIYDLAGKTHLRGKLNGPEQISIANLLPGTYLFEASDINNKKYLSRFVKQ